MPGFGSVGVWEVILILAVLLLVFGAKRLPEIGAALGKGIREFKGSVKDIENEINRPSSRSDLPRGDTAREEPRRTEPRHDDPAPRVDEPAPPAPRRSEVEAPRREPEQRPAE